MNLFDVPDGMDQLDVVAISATSQDYIQALKIAQSIKEKNRNIITILGGHHITYLPETLTEDFDIGVRGEGEQTFLHLIRYFQENNFRVIPEKLHKIQGIIFRENGQIIITEKRKLINLDDIPHPNRQCVCSQYIFTSRGCPFKCSFCSSSAFWEKTRFFSAEYVVEEIEQIMQQFPETLQVPIWDDLFIADKKRLHKIIDLVEEKGINKKLKFSFSVRSNLVDDEMCKALKRLNVVGVAFGAESGSDRILKLMNKEVSVNKNQMALDLLYTYRIPVMCSFIVGWTTETEKEVKETFDFILRNISAGKQERNETTDRNIIKYTL
jgi:anaerobic magnesium-protoporphyrin IX monomethyl ester cyclase